MVGPVEQGQCFGVLSVSGLIMIIILLKKKKKKKKKCSFLSSSIGDQKQILIYHSGPNGVQS